MPSNRTMPRSYVAMTSDLLFYFNVDQLKFVDILSVRNNKLLLGQHHDIQLVTYDFKDNHFSTIQTIGNYLFHAAWTPLGNIVYTVSNANYVVRILDSSNVSTRSHILDLATFISVSNDDVIYLAAGESGIYQSLDDGISWSFVFKPAEHWYCRQVIKLIIDGSENFWTIEQTNYKHGLPIQLRLSVYKSNRTRSDKIAKLRDVNSGEIVYTPLICLLYNVGELKLSYDSNMNIFVSNGLSEVHVFLANGQYLCDVVNRNLIETTIYALAVDNNNRLLYIGQYDGFVGVFKLSYDDNRNRKEAAKLF